MIETLLGGLLGGAFRLAPEIFPALSNATNDAIKATRKEMAIRTGSQDTSSIMSSHAKKTV